MSFFVYVDRTNDGTPFYVGKGSSRRISYVRRNTKHRHVRNTHGFQRTIEFETLDEKRAFDCERSLIVEHHTYVGDPLSGPLACNFTTGGDGTSGFKWTPEARARVSLQRKGRNNRTGFKHSEATKQKQCESKLGTRNPNFGKSPWNKGKKLGPDAARKGWETRRQRGVQS
jgi:hypothetical protein